MKARLRRPVALVAVALVALPAAAGAALPRPVTIDGVGGVTPGMPPGLVAERWGIAVDPLGTPGSPCAAAEVRAGALRGYALFRSNRFAAVFFRAGARTGKGIRIGSTRAELQAAYGSALRSRPNKYTPGARDWFVRRAKAPRWQLRFDVSRAGKVTAIAFGDRAVELVEGCA